MINKLRNIKPGESICYYKGTTPMSMMPAAPQKLIFNEAMHMSDIGVAFLVQKKLTHYGNSSPRINTYEYTAVGGK